VRWSHPLVNGGAGEGGWGGLLLVGTCAGGRREGTVEERPRGDGVSRSTIPWGRTLAVALLDSRSAHVQVVGDRFISALTNNGRRMHIHVVVIILIHLI
jgi:hypothetical protein